MCYFDLRVDIKIKGNMFNCTVPLTYKFNCLCELCVKQDKQFATSLSDYFFHVQTCMDLPNIPSLHMLVLGNSEPSAFEINDSLRDKQSL